MFRWPIIRANAGIMNEHTVLQTTPSMCITLSRTTMATTYPSLMDHQTHLSGAFIIYPL